MVGQCVAVKKVREGQLLEKIEADNTILENQIVFSGC
jgi:hypothetical protein